MWVGGLGFVFYSGNGKK